MDSLDTTLIDASLEHMDIDSLMPELAATYGLGVPDLDVSNEELVRDRCLPNITIDIQKRTIILGNRCRGQQERPNEDLIEAMEAFEATFEEYWGPPDSEEERYAMLSNRPASPNSM